MSIGPLTVDALAPLFVVGFALLLIAAVVGLVIGQLRRQNDWLRRELKERSEEVARAHHIVWRQRMATPQIGDTTVKPDQRLTDLEKDFVALKASLANLLPVLERYASASRDGMAQADRALQELRGHVHALAVAVQGLDGRTATLEEAITSLAEDRADGHLEAQMVDLTGKILAIDGELSDLAARVQGLVVGAEAATDIQGAEDDLATRLERITLDMSRLENDLSSLQHWLH